MTTDNLTHWRLCDSFTIEQAAMLIAGLDPATNYSTDSGFFHDNPACDAAYSALKHAIMDGTLPATIRRDSEQYGWATLDYMTKDDRVADAVTRDGNIVKIMYHAEPNWNKTTIQRKHIVGFLKARGFTDGFFIASHDDSPDYLNPEHPRYAPKLAAAVNAWLAVGEVKGKTPKQALDKCLRENAVKYGLTDDEGNPVNQAIEDISKVANWQTKGGASKTPG